MTTTTTRPATAEDQIHFVARVLNAHHERCLNEGDANRADSLFRAAEFAEEIHYDLRNRAQMIDLLFQQTEEMVEICDQLQEEVRQLRGEATKLRKRIRTLEKAREAAKVKTRAKIAAARAARK